MAYFDVAFEKTLGHEGGYVNDPDDPGGETKYGISKRAYPDLDIAAMTAPEARLIYKADYWYKIKGDEIDDQGVANTLFDAAVNIGVRPACRLAQKALGLDDDGIIGPVSMAVMNYADPSTFINAFAVERTRYYIGIVERRPTSRKYLLGWIKRVVA